MAQKTLLTKVSVTTDDGRNDLCTINKSQSLDANIRELCKRFSMPSETIFALKFSQTNDGRVLNTYVTDDNYEEIKDGFFLKLTYSADIYVKRIFENFHNYGRAQSFEDLHKLCSDPGFISEMVKQAKIEDLMELLISELSDKELAISLTTLLFLLKRNCVEYLPGEILYKMFDAIKSGKSKPELLQPTLAVLCQLLFMKGSDFHVIKQKIVNEIRITDLIPYLSMEDGKLVQLNTLMLINTIVKVVKGEKRFELIKELNMKQNRESVFVHVIKDKGNVDPAIAHELHVYQSYIMSLYKSALETYLDPLNNIFFSKEEFELNEDDDKGSFIIDFQDLLEKSRQNSVDAFLNELDNVRFSIASTSTRESVATLDSNVSDSSYSSNGFRKDKLRISHLALENLRYYKNRHTKNFKKSLLEETAYEPGIYVTSENVTQMLAEMLNIGRQPDKQGQCYQPLVFNPKLKFPFLPELFSRTMWLLSKTRCEMKASIKDDYPKVLQVLRKQVEMVLMKKPMDFKQLTFELDKISYKDVAKIWEREKAIEWDEILETNPSVQEYKNEIRIECEKLVSQQRIGVLQKGEIFPKLPQKKGKLAHILIKLSENKRKLIWCDWDFKNNMQPQSNYSTLNVADIKHIIVGQACLHVKDNTVKAKEHQRAFSLMFEDESFFNFFAKDTRIASYWVDGLNLLLDKDNRSELYREELNELVKMDCTLQLLELQEVEIPKSPPPLPPLPPGCGPKPALPPKAPHLLKKVKIYDQVWTSKVDNSESEL